MMNLVRMKVVLWPVNLMRWKWGNAMFYTNGGAEKLGIISVWILSGKREQWKPSGKRSLFSCIYSRYSSCLSALGSQRSSSLLAGCMKIHRLSQSLLLPSRELSTYKGGKGREPWWEMNSSGWERKQERRETMREEKTQVLSAIAQPPSSGSELPNTVVTSNIWLFTFLKYSIITRLLSWLHGTFHVFTSHICSLWLPHWVLQI